MMGKLKEIQFHEIINADRFKDAVFQPELYKKAVEAALKKLEQNLDKFIYQYPHVSMNNIYSPMKNQLWTASFFPGIAYLACEITRDKSYIKYADEYVKCFKWRLENGHTVTHDLGFLYTLSCAANYKITGNNYAREIGIKAADILAGRYNEKGRYIQAWGDIGLKYPDVKIIIDTMLNLPLLYWASDETGNVRYRDIAVNHGFTAAENLVRKDASTYHTYLMNPDTGEAVIGKTHQGRHDESTWARGQGWAVYGFALCYRHTGDPYFLDVAIKTANFFINNLPEDFVPYWDFSFDDKEQDIKDSSAAAILLCGLLELAKYLEGWEKELYFKVVYKIIEALYVKYSTKTNFDSNGLILHGMYHRNDGADECTIWGDYFYFETLVRLLKDWKSYW